jgi:hypothetical protein
MNDFQTFYANWIEVDEETWWTRLRHWRNEQLKSTDWQMISDVPNDKKLWAEYRQALRDLPAITKDPKNPTIPVKPNA